jgi:hypothetical protein
MLSVKNDANLISGAKFFLATVLVWYWNYKIDFRLRSSPAKNLDTHHLLETLFFYTWTNIV